MYRRKEELEEWKEKDPIPRFEKRLLDLGVLTPEKIQEIKSSVKKQLEDAERFAEESPYPDPADVTLDVYTA